ncbi:MAG: HAD family hydrolase [Sandaracinus sp.]|nr:HAD family hydrolase [Myxococcales bacterium]MCB9615801.1 HAD family hydrolase [Sandaracinus sp.]
MLPPPLPHQVQVLQNVLDRVSVAAVDGGPTPIVVFGIDGALFDSRPRTLQVLHDYADEATDDADVAGALRSLTVDHVHYLLSETLRECAITHAEHVRAITSFWRDRFHTDEYVVLDEPTPGAVDYVRAIHDAGGSVILLSGRDVHGMLLGTVQSLRDHGMPIADVGVELVLKPDATLGTEAFKRHTLPRLSRRGEVVAVFDDQASSCELALSIFPEASVSLVDTWMLEQHLAAGIEHFRDFRLL